MPRLAKIAVAQEVPGHCDPGRAAVPGIRRMGLGNRLERGILRPKLAQGGQFDERLLNDVLGRTAPLPRVENERGQVAIEQVAQEVRVH